MGQSENSRAVYHLISLSSVDAFSFYKSEDFLSKVFWQILAKLKLPVKSDTSKLF